MNVTQREWTRPIAVIWTALFLVSIVVPLTGVFFNRDAKSATENRTLSPMPRLIWTAEGLSQFPSGFEKFLDDRFALRQKLIEWHNRFYIDVFKASPFPAVVLGRNGWLFYNSAKRVPAEDSLADYAGQPLLSDKQLEAWRKSLAEIDAYLRERNTPFFVVVAPNKEAVYREEMPGTLNGKGESPTIDQFKSYIERHTDIEVLDLRAALFRQKASGPVYHRTDTHWNAVGAFAGYEVIAAKLKELGILARTQTWDDYEIRTVEGTAGWDLSRMLNLPKYLVETTYPFMVPREPYRAKLTYAPTDPPIYVISTGGSPDAPKALVLRDSFSNALIPFMSEDFRSVTYIWDRRLPVDVFQREKPGVVIAIIVERCLRIPPETGIVKLADFL